MPEATWSAKLFVTPVEHIGSNKDCIEWANNLVGCEVRIVGKDGKDHVVGIADRVEANNLSWQFRPR